MLSDSAARGTGAFPTRFSQNHGFSVLEVLVIVVIVSVIAAIGVPTLHRAGASAVLDGNARNLAALVEEEMLQGLDNTYRQAGEGSPDKYLSSRLEYVLGQAVGAARYSNPRVDGPTTFTILNSASIPADASSASPAVFITDNPECRFKAFDSQIDEAGRQRLAGSLVVQFNSTARSVDVFFVDQKGNKSADVVQLPAG